MSPPRDGLVTARVADVTFYGHDTAVHLEVLPSGPAVVARIFGVQVPATGAVVSLKVSGPVAAFARPPGPRG
jgi:iron(III) transport system ATP-binding protein